MTKNKLMKHITVMAAIITCLGFSIKPLLAENNKTSIESYLGWFKPANAHLRTAISYLRTGNTDFAALALEDLIAAKAPDVTDKVLQNALKSTVKKAQTALDQIDNNEPDNARAMLLTMRADIFARHQKSNIKVFDDCIWTLVQKGPTLWYYRKKKADLNNDGERQSVAKAAADYLAQLNLCDSQATPQIKADESYKRIVNGARQSLHRIPTEALANKDGGQLYRFIIELRSFDRLLYFRFG